MSPTLIYAATAGAMLLMLAVTSRQCGGDRKSRKIVMLSRRLFLYQSPGMFAPAAAGAPATTTFDAATKSSHITLSGGALIATSGSGSGTGTNARSVASHSSGKYYAEFTLTTRVGPDQAVGICNSSFVADTTYLGGSANAVGYWSDGNILGGAGGSYVTFAQGDVISLAVDTTARLAWWRKNAGAWSNAGDPAAGTAGNDISGITGALFAIAEGEANGDVWTANFGGTAYAQTAPSGFGNW